MVAIHRRLPGVLPFLLTGWAVVLPAAAQTAPDSARVQVLKTLLAPRAQGVGRPVTDRPAWEAVAKLPGLKGCVTAAEKALQQPLPELTDDVYLDFSRTGNRTRGQNVIFARHGRLPTLVIAECVENRGRFLAGIEETIRALCAERSWLLPAHDRGLENYHGKTMEIDLASSAASWTLATADYWLGDRLSRQTRDLIRSELERRTLVPFENYARTGKPRLWWATGTNNWNAVCLAGVTGTALTLVDEPERRAWFAAAAEKYVQNFLQGFTPDGYCSEGIGYYNYGFGHYVLLAETLFQATGGKLDLLESPLVRQISQFGPRMEIQPGLFPAFADCSPRARPDSHLLAYLSRRYGFGWQETERQAVATAGHAHALFELGVYDFPSSLAGRPTASPAAAEPALRDWFADAGILICRPAAGQRNALAVALKGGHNAEHHNHNDLGSYVVAWRGEAPLLDPGAEVYTARTFSSKRYESQVLNSFGHAVPLVAGQLQREGRQAAARVLHCEFTETADTIAFDLRSAYRVKALQKLQRTFVYSRQGSGSLTVSDEVEFSEPQAFGTALITFSPDVRIDGRTIVIGKGPAAVQAEIESPVACKVRTEELHEDVHGSHLPVRIGIDLADLTRKATLTVRIRPADKS